MYSAEVGLLTQVTLTQRAYPAARTCPKCKGEWRNLIFHPYYYCSPAMPPHPNAPVAPKDVELVSIPRAQGKSSDPDQGKSVKKGRRAGNMGSGKTPVPLWFRQKGSSALLRGCISSSVQAAAPYTWVICIQCWQLCGESGLQLFYWACIVF